MVVNAIKYAGRTYELRKGPKRYIGYLPGGQQVIPESTDEDATKRFLRLFLESTRDYVPPRPQIGTYLEMQQEKVRKNRCTQCMFNR